MNLTVIAAGDGSRLKSEGMEPSKPMVVVDGVPMIERMIRIFDECNPEGIYVKVRPESDALEHVKTLVTKAPMTTLIGFTPSGFHTLSACVEASGIESINCIVTVDTIFDPAGFKTMLSELEKDDDCDGYMGVSYYIDDEKPLYVGADKETGFINVFSEAPVSDMCSAGVYALKPSALKMVEEGMRDGVGTLSDFQRYMLTRGMRLRPFDMGTVIDVDHVSDAEKANILIRNNYHF